MLQRLPITLSQVERGTSSENLLNEMRQIIEITKKVYNNIMNSTKL